MGHPAKSETLLEPESTDPDRPYHRASNQRYTTPDALAEYLGYSPVTVRVWLRQGKIPGAQMQPRHYTDDRSRRTGRAQWRIYEDDVLQLLAHMRQGGTIRSFGRGFWKGGPKR